MSLARQGAGYTIYTGLARRPELIALPLDAQGRPAGKPTTLLDLSAAGATPQERARKLRLVGDQLIIDLVPFTLSLQANATDVPQVRQAVWGWDAGMIPIPEEATALSRCVSETCQLRAADRSAPTMRYIHRELV